MRSDAATEMPFLVMELLRGEDLSQRLKRVGRLPPGEVLTYLQQAALGLDRTHAAAIVHRDLKPQNLFLTQREDGAPLVKILDFGIAKIVAEGVTAAGATQSLGTPFYMAPEQFRTATNLTPAVDIYALGMVAYTLMVGKAYWSREAQEAGNLMALAMAAVQGPIDPATQRAAALGVALPPGFDAWFAVATAVSPAARFPTAGEAVRALATALAAAPGPVAAQERTNVGGGTVLLETVPLEGTTATSAALTVAPTARRARPVVLAAALAFTVVGVGTWIGLRAWGHGADPAPATAPSSATETAGAPAASATTKSSSSPPASASPPVVDGTGREPDTGVDDERRGCAPPHRPCADPPRPDDGSPRRADPERACSGVTERWTRTPWTTARSRDEPEGQHVVASKPLRRGGGPRQVAGSAAADDAATAEARSSTSAGFADMQAGRHAKGCPRHRREPAPRSLAPARSSPWRPARRSGATSPPRSRGMVTPPGPSTSGSRRTGRRPPKEKEKARQGRQGAPRRSSRPWCPS